MPTALESYDTQTMKVLHLVQAETRMLPKLVRFFSQISEGPEMQRILNTFNLVIGGQSERMEDGHGFIVSPVTRLLSYVVCRQYLKKLLGGAPLNISENLIYNTTRILGRCSGFMAEIKARLWVYKGVNFQSIPNIYSQDVTTYFYSDLGLTQILINEHPKTFSTYLLAFGTLEDFSMFQAYFLNKEEFVAPQQLADKEKFGLLL